MSHDLYTYGSTDPIYFKVTLAGVGVTGLTFQDADIELSKDGGNWASINADTTVVEVEAAAGYGVYKWTPQAASETQCEVMVLNIKDAVGSAFDENCLIISTGGNASARFSG